MILFASEPQVNLRNHLPPGDSFFSRVNVLDFSLEPRTELRKQLARRGFFIWFKCCNIHPRAPGELEKSFTAWGFVFLIAPYGENPPFCHSWSC